MQETEARPEWVCCIKKEKLTWCGKPSEGWCFVDLEHAVLTEKAGGRLVACPECVERGATSNSDKR